MMDNILEVHNLSKSFQIKTNNLFAKKDYVHAVKNVSFEIKRGTTFGLVGESGSGKTTVGKSILGLYGDIEGEIYYKGQNIINKYQTHQSVREIQVVFQDPYASLNPTMTLKEIILEPLKAQKLSHMEQNQLVDDLLERVRLSSQFALRYPHELSGGQRQRIGIARALSTKPDLIILDEPISALDVIIQAKIVKLLKQLQEEIGVSYLFIAHDLEMVRFISQNIGVMYQGQIIEYGNVEMIYNNPQHQYTRHLIDSILIPDPRQKSLLNSQTEDWRSNIEPSDKWQKINNNHYVLN